MSIYTKNASGTVKLLMNNPAALKYPTADGTANQAVITNGSGVLSFGSAGVSTGKSIAMAMIFGF
jgi:Tfp pilus assembly protein FimT